MPTLPVRAPSVFVPSTGYTTLLPNAAHEHFDVDAIAEINAWLDNHDAPPTDADLDRLYDEYREMIGSDCGDDEPESTPPAESPLAA